MGIQGLLPTLKSVITQVHVRQYAGMKVAIDTYSWLHKAAFTCCKDLCEGRPTDKFIDYCMHRVNLLRHHGVQPVLVFDGGVLPMKADQEAKRTRSRKENLERAREHERSGNHSAAFECYQKAVDITPAIAFRLIKVLQQEGVEYIVAPYEADAQMAYLALHNHVQVIITEDSDLIAYGCPRILFKMDKSGLGDEFQYNDIVRNKDLNFTNFTRQMVLEMCIMSGCDYLPSLPGMGVKRAHGLIRRFKGHQKVIRHLRFSGITITPQYEELFERALLTFHHQRVYDPVSEEMVHVSEVPTGLNSALEFLGPYLPQKLVKAIAVGEVDPTTNLPFEEAIAAVKPGLQQCGYRNFTHQSGYKKAQELLARRNVLTNYFFSATKEIKKQFRAPRSALSTGTAEICLTEDAVGPPVSLATDSLDGNRPIPDLCKVFGSPLPADDDRVGCETDTSQEVHAKSNWLYEIGSHLPAVDDGDITVGLEQERKSFRKTSLLQEEDSTNLKAPIQNSEPVDRIEQIGLNSEGAFESSLRHQVFHASAIAAGKSFTKERNTKYAVPQVKRSGYFSHSEVVQSILVRCDTAEFTNEETEGSREDSQSCFAKVLKKIRVDSCEGVSEKAETSLSSRKELSQEVSDLPATSKKSSSSIVPEKRTEHSPFERFLHECGDSSKVGELSSNVSHVSHFAHVAEKSMNKFVTSIAPFRCSSRGTRPSGLRAPSKDVAVAQNRKR